jgi:hypothetical protein
MRRTVLRHGCRSLAAITIGLVAAAIFATPANAGINMYQHANYGGGVAVNFYSNATYHDGDRFSNGAYLADAISSVNNDNGNGARVCFYTDHYYGGDIYCLAPSEYVSYVGKYWNDRFSSHYAWW